MTLEDLTKFVNEKANTFRLPGGGFDPEAGQLSVFDKIVSDISYNCDDYSIACIAAMARKMRELVDESRRLTPGELQQASVYQNWIESILTTRSASALRKRRDELKLKLQNWTASSASFSQRKDAALNLSVINYLLDVLPLEGLDQGDYAIDSSPDSALMEAIQAVLPTVDVHSDHTPQETETQEQLLIQPHEQLLRQQQEEEG
eukprot:GHVT01047659.1.p1 GENE.GHVT01047659.1~~GHVT01047659.1.p1  ORF type:complete len:204 (-),score=46.79 GHVT01047659.1:369-980(-)